MGENFRPVDAAPFPFVRVPVNSVISMVWPMGIGAR